MNSPEADGTLVDWGLAERIAVAIGRAGVQPQPPPADELSLWAGRAIGEVAEYTRLEPQEAIPEPELVGRDEWIRANLTTFRDMGAELERRVHDSVSLPGPLGPVMRTLAGTVAGGELGVVLGYVGRKVLGQYDLALIGPERPPRLLYVGPNLGDAHGRLGGQRAMFVHWVALHETTHAFQFASVPWLRGHLGGLVERLLQGAGLAPDLGELRDAIGRILRRPDPRRLAEPLREGGLIRLVAGPEQTEALRGLQAAMSVIEGYAEHVMDAVGEELDPGYASLRKALESERRSRSVIDTLIARLLGLDVKLRQYELGKRFADAVAERSGIEGLNEVWRAPDSLPDTAELEDPERWLARVAVG